ncbi:MAG: type II toxin-antitoxin system mRNA interferase toxin, RelE/StbE family [Propionibacteriaceae bacterium]|jgi:addiction module RelE/StbE family toxin|nr:type II toxin-antitoxin system mRNA interferase toxin, RelE/StbE family [Propionibacteriaceae bacterium]
MNVRFSKRLVKQLAKLSKRIQATTYTRIDLMLANPDDPILRRHRLKGHLHHLWSIDITSDVRALYETIGDDAIIYQLIGTHSELYR